MQMQWNLLSVTKCSEIANSMCVGYCDGWRESVRQGTVKFGGNNGRKNVWWWFSDVKGWGWKNLF